MSKKYTLVNPSITGTMETSVSASSPMDAAKKIWEKISPKMSSTPRYGISLQNGSEFSHFIIKEKEVKNKVQYDISQWDVSEDATKLFKKSLDGHRAMVGGDLEKKKKRYRKDDDDDDDDDEYNDLKYMYKKLVKNSDSYPIYHWWYYPHIYPVQTLYYPTVFDVVYTEIVTSPYWPMVYPIVSYS